MPEFSPEDAKSYVRITVRALKENPSVLSEWERVLASRYVDAVSGAEGAEKEISQIENQMLQSRARIDELRSKRSGDEGRAAACIECMVALHFEQAIVDPKDLEPVA